MNVFLFLLAAAAYFIPSIVAGPVRHKHDAREIALMNLFLGWTVIVWVICLVRALQEDQTKEVKPTESLVRPDERIKMVIPYSRLKLPFDRSWRANLRAGLAGMGGKEVARYEVTWTSELVITDRRILGPGGGRLGINIIEPGHPDPGSLQIGPKRALQNMFLVYDHDFNETLKTEFDYSDFERIKQIKNEFGEKLHKSPLKAWKYMYGRRDKDLDEFKSSLENAHSFHPYVWDEITDIKIRRDRHILNLFGLLWEETFLSINFLPVLAPSYMEFLKTSGSRFERYSAALLGWTKRLENHRPGTLEVRVKKNEQSQISQLYNILREGMGGLAGIHEPQILVNLDNKDNERSVPPENQIGKMIEVQEDPSDLIIPKVTPIENLGAVNPPQSDLRDFKIDTMIEIQDHQSNLKELGLTPIGNPMEGTPSPTSPSAVIKLERLKGMLDDGLITQQDYDEQKKKILKII